ncbi:MAG TPA: exosortase/archaeosortase family protein [Gemmatimonadaceae bacterium]|jgi:exosortase|nr:exosortase/archaeosortase family protein [Gemmatimonadaceae bacterium]
MTPVTGITMAAFVACFLPVMIGLIQGWLTIPDAAHGILIAPVALWLAWKSGTRPAPRPDHWSGVIILVFAVSLNIIGRTAGVATVPRVALLIALVGLTIWYAGWRQVTAWWLPFILLALTIPLPESIIAAITLPLQGIAARLGASLIAWRHVPVVVSGNIITLPGHTLFVSEACSGLRSLTALVSMAILIGALFLHKPLTRLLMVATAVGVAIFINGVRVFLTGFLVFFVDPKLGEGFMHLTQGYLLFLVSLMILAGVTWLFMVGERRFAGESRRPRTA